MLKFADRLQNISCGTDKGIWTKDRLMKYIFVKSKFWKNSQYEKEQIGD